MLDTRDPAPAAKQTSAKHYDALSQLFHWTTALLMVAVVVFAWVMVEMGRDNPDRPAFYMIHKSLGMIILGLVALRILWRATHRAPPLPAHLTGLESFLAKSSHVLLYAIMIVMPISGYIASSAAGRSITIFDLVTLPSFLPEDKALSKAAIGVHEAVQWAVYAVVGLHVLATMWHVAVRRDGVLGRILPRQVNAE